MDQLPATMEGFISGTEKNRQSSAPEGGGFLKFNGKTGDWSLGQDEIDVEGEILIVNILSAQHGFVRWGEKLPAKAYSRISEPKPTPPASFDGVDDDGAPKTYHPVNALRVGGAFIEDDLGDFKFEVNSMGGVERLDELFDKALAQAHSGSLYFFPKVSLANDFYKRGTGKVFKPVFEIIEWVNMEGEVEGEAPKKVAKAPEPAPEVEPEPEAPKRRRRKRA